MKKNIFKRKFIKAFRDSYQADHMAAVHVLRMVLSHHKVHGYRYETYLTLALQQWLPLGEIASEVGFTLIKSSEKDEDGIPYCVYAIHKGDQVLWDMVSYFELRAQTMLTPPHPLFNPEEYEMWKCSSVYKL